jgi:hypothetical protein
LVRPSIKLRIFGSRTGARHFANVCLPAQRN